MCDLFNMSYWKCKQIIQSKWHHLLNTIKSFKFERTRRKINIHLQVVTLNLKNMHFEILMETKNQWLFVFIEWIWEMKGGLRMVSIPFKILIHLYGKFNFFICAYWSLGFCRLLDKNKIYNLIHYARAVCTRSKSDFSTNYCSIVVFRYRPQGWIILGN